MASRISPKRSPLRRCRLPHAPKCQSFGLHRAEAGIGQHPGISAQPIAQIGHLQRRQVIAAPGMERAQPGVVEERIEVGFREASVRTSDDAKRRAFGHVFGSINSAVSFPSQVFLGSWGAFLFFESDRLFSPGFAVIAAGLLNAEGAEVCCLLNLSETDRMVYEEAAMLFIDAGMEPHSYDAALRQGGPANGWLFGMDRYGSASDRGDGAFTARRGTTLPPLPCVSPTIQESMLSA